MNKFIVITGPCQIESRDHAIEMADYIWRLRYKIPAIDLYYKSSFDKANRTGYSSARGLGLDKGLEILQEVRQIPQKSDPENEPLKVLTDVHETWQCPLVGEVVDALQIPAMLSRQTDLIETAANCTNTLNIKIMQTMSPADACKVAEKAMMPFAQNVAKAPEIWLTYRGTAFGYNTLINDMLLIPFVKERAKVPVIIDATHSVQQPGVGGNVSGGDRTKAPYIAKAAVAVGADGLFAECHTNPDKALSDGPNSMHLKDVRPLIEKLLDIRNLL